MIEMIVQAALCMMLVCVAIMIALAVLAFGKLVWDFLQDV